jgi:hypothetical protein
LPRRLLVSRTQLDKLEERGYLDPDLRGNRADDGDAIETFLRTSEKVLERMATSDKTTRFQFLSNAHVAFSRRVPGLTACDGASRWPWPDGPGHYSRPNRVLHGCSHQSPLYYPDWDRRRARGY